MDEGGAASDGFAMFMHQINGVMTVMFIVVIGLAIIMCVLKFLNAWGRYKGGDEPDA